LWAQDLWRFAPDWRATVGGRLESWQASNGFNFSGTTGVSQPKISSTNFSPKASLSWDAKPDLTVTASFGQAYRYPTVSELYQLVQTGSLFSSPNPNLSPENVLSGELAFLKQIDDGSVRVSFFQENVRDALISQTSFLTGATPVTFVSNVGEVRNRGIEIAGQRDDILVHGFGLSGSLTYVDSEILSDAGFVSTTGTTAVGKRAPNVPEWRATLVATYKPTDDLSFSVASRYSSRAFSTVDNTDAANNVFGGFGQFFVVDVRAQYKIMKGVEASLGIDNLTNDKYYLFHPFPQRTVLASLKLAL
jgi:iron complex outermembrane receptor protein